MIKLFGAVLILSATAAFGLFGVFRLKNRVRSLGALNVSLELMKSELCERLTPMPELLEMLERDAPSPANLLFGQARQKLSELGNCSFAAIWKRAIRDTPELLLTEQEAQVLGELGLSLGKYDVHEQLGAFTYTQRRMEEFYKKAAAEKENDAKLHAFFGVAAGAVAVIILI